MPGIVVSGALANKPGNGGNVWAVLSWVRGFRNLGMPTCFVEQIRREHCVDAAGAPAPFRESANLAYFARATAALGVADCAALILDDGAEIYGMSRSALEEAAETSALLVNITGHLSWRHLTQRCRRKAYVDFDPAFTQIWNAQGNPGPRLEHHDVYFTLGENIGRPECSVPTGNIDWLHVRQPVVLNDWPVAVTVEREQFTTVASWRGPYGLLEHDGKTLGGKVHEFRKFIELPRHTGARLELALDIHPADAGDRQRLEAHGWTVVDAGEVAATPERFQTYVQHSFAEFSVAQGAYVGTQCGWFSDRTIRYLATGRPAVVQDTGFSRNFPVGDGLVAFSTVQEALSGIEDIRRGYAQHSCAARQLAERYFDSDKVLSQFIEAAGA